MGLSWRVLGLSWLVLPVVLLCAEATDLFVALGQNATLTCSVNTSDVHWYIEVRSEVKAPLGRTFSGEPCYDINTTLNNKYLLVRNQLVVNTVSAEDYRRYFCGRKKNSSVVLNNTFHLFPNVSTTSLTNCSEETQQQYSSRVFQLIVYVSLALNAVFVIVGLVLTALCLKRKICSRQVNEPSPFTSENPEPLEGPQYEEIHLRAPPPAAPMECIYYKAQLPGSPLPRQH